MNNLSLTLNHSGIRGLLDHAVRDACPSVVCENNIILR